MQQCPGGLSCVLDQAVTIACMEWGSSAPDAATGAPTGASPAALAVASPLEAPSCWPGRLPFPGCLGFVHMRVLTTELL